MKNFKKLEIVPTTISNYDKISSFFVCNLGYEKCVKDHEFGPAIRDHYLLHFVLNGTGVFNNNHKEFNISTGMGFLITPNELTYYKADDTFPWEYIWFGINGSQIINILDKIGISSQNPIFNFNIDKLDAKNFINFLNENNNSYYKELKVISYIYDILSNVAKHTKKEINQSSNPKIYLSYAMDYINKNYAYSIKVNKLAEFIGIDRTYLFKLFKEYINISPEEYIIKVRLDNAKRLLNTTSLNITQVALSTGFYDIAHFSYAFKKQFKISPKEYKNSI